MSTLTRKQRELLEREQLILNAAQTMLHQQGYRHLTMERIAETVEYSKGTIYNHFASKEDLVCSLCCRCFNNLIEVLERAFKYPGSTRDRFSAIGIAYSLYYQLHPVDIQNIQTARNFAIRENVSQEKLQEMELLEHKITSIAKNIVQQAIDCGDLDKKHQADVNTIVFGFWSMHYGALLLEQSDIPLQQLGYNPVVQMLWKDASIYLDGYQWKPLSTTTDATKLFKKISSTLFD
jgi:AcrR family transcriptional regulator